MREKVWGEVDVRIEFFFLWFADNRSHAELSENFKWEESTISWPFGKLHVFSSISHVQLNIKTSKNSISSKLSRFVFSNFYCLIYPHSPITLYWISFSTPFLPLSSTETEVRMRHLQSQSLYCIRFFNNLTDTCREKFLDTHRTSNHVFTENLQ